MLLSTPLQVYIADNNPQFDLDLNPCDPQIFNRGIPLMKIDGKKYAVETLVGYLAKELDLKLDWHYSGGVAQVLLLGNQDDHTKAYNFVSTLIKVQLEFDYLEEFDENLLNLIKDEFCYQKELIKLSPDLGEDTIKIVVDTIHADQILQAFDKYTHSNEHHYFRKFCIPPLDDIFMVHLVPFGGQGLYRSTEHGPVDNSNIDESRVVRST